MPHRQARRFVKIDPFVIRKAERAAVTAAVTRITHPVDRLLKTVAIIKDAKEIIEGNPARVRTVALMSLAFYNGGMEGLPRVAGISSRTYDAMRREVLRLPEGTLIPIGKDGEAAARKAGVVELREDAALGELVRVVTEIVGAQGRSEAAVTLRQDAILEVSSLSDWDTEAIAAACGITIGQVYTDKSKALRRHSQASQPKITKPTRAVLNALLGQGLPADTSPGAQAGYTYGRKLTELTGLPSGTLSPILERLLGVGWVESRWEEGAIAKAEKRPRRRYYWLTEEGAKHASAIIAEAKHREAAPA